MVKSDLPYTHNEKLNPLVTEIMNDWFALVEKARVLGFTFRLAPHTIPMEFYFHNDYPDMILVDKYSCELDVEKMEENKYGKQD